VRVEVQYCKLEAQGACAAELKKQMYMTCRYDITVLTVTRTHGVSSAIVNCNGLEVFNAFSPGGHCPPDPPVKQTDMFAGWYGCI